ncbi:hypothetical protein LCM17_14100 [Cereibacter sphaeroides]|nr:hypothetical protein [Cereibacter sphaeroides]
MFLAILEAILRLPTLALLSAAFLSSPTFAQSPTSTVLRIMPETVSPNTALELHAFVTSPESTPTGSVVFRRGARVIGRAELTASEHGFGQLSVGDGHVCSIDPTGQVFCWGNNESGQVGNGQVGRQNVPTPVNLPEPAVQITTGYQHSCALLASGALWCWGANGFGQLGIGRNPSRAVSPRRVPDASSPYAQVSAGSATTCAITEAGAAYCWGINDFGQLGDGTRRIRYRPTLVSGLSSNVRQIVTSGGHSCAIIHDMSVMCWGNNSSGQLALGHTLDQRVPRLILGDLRAASLSLGSWHSCLVDVGGQLHCWGQNDWGELGIGSLEYRFAPTAVPGQTGIRQVELGGQHSCALNENAEVHCWGNNENFQIGDGSYRNRLRPSRTRLASRDRPVAISAGLYNACAVVNNGQLRCWGSGVYGRVGDTNFGDARRPVRITGGRVSGPDISAIATLPVPEGFDEGLIRLRAVFEGNAEYERSRSPVTELQVE